MLEILTEQFFINSLIAILIMSLVTGSLGSFMIWKKLSYLGDSISHSSLLGVALAIMLNINTSFSIVLIAIIFAILLSINLDKMYSVDTVLNIVTNVIMSLGLLLISFFPSANNNIIHSLFGDILMLDSKDLLIILLISILIITIIIYRWKYWLMISINRDLAISEGVNVALIKLEFLIILSIFIAISAQIIGILLITAFLVIPAAAARLITKNPVQMIIGATIISIVSGVLGLVLSAQFDTFPGPLIIIISFLLLMLLYSLRSRFN